MDDNDISTDDLEQMLLGYKKKKSPLLLRLFATMSAVAFFVLVSSLLIAGIVLAWRVIL